MSKSPDLLAGLDLFKVLLRTQVEARYLAATWWFSLGPFSLNRDFCLADFMEVIFKKLTVDQKFTRFELGNSLTNGYR